MHGIDLDIAHDEFVVLVGPSGCGKSTTLRMIAGLEDMSAGDILIDGHVVNEVAPKDRDIAMVFQDYALYPHMSVYDNLAFGLQMQSVPRREIDERVREAADILGIAILLERKPKQLSGGQRQRVAMGRAIVRHPKVFLFDEPLSNLDAQLRVQMRTEIKKLHRRVATTIVYVTHDQVEAMTLADRIVVMRGGMIEQVGTPEEVYNRPASMFVGGFIGSPMMNFVPCQAELSRAGPGIALAGGIRLPIDAAALTRLRPGEPLIVGIRAEHFSLAAPRQRRIRSAGRRGRAAGIGYAGLQPHRRRGHRRAPAADGAHRRGRPTRALRRYGANSLLRSGERKSFRMMTKASVVAPHGAARRHCSDSIEEDNMALRNFHRPLRVAGRIAVLSLAAMTLALAHLHRRSRRRSAS